MKKQLVLEWLLALTAGTASAYGYSSFLQSLWCFCFGTFHLDTKTSTEIGLKVKHNAQLITGTIRITDNIGVVWLVQRRSLL